MIATDIEVVKATFAAFAARDIEAVLALASPDIEFTAVTGEQAGRSTPYRGHEGMRQYFRDVASVWEELHLSPREFRASDDLILVTGRVSARSRSRTVTGSTGWIWRVRDGKVVYVRVYGSAADATVAFEEGEPSWGFVALGGTTYAAVTLPKNSVGAKQIKKNGVGASEIKRSAVRTGEVRNGALRAEDFAAGQLPQGPKGDPGQNGTNGAPGADGTADAFARVDLNAGRTLEPNDAGFAPQNKRIVQANVVPGEGAAATGTTCFDLLSRPASAVVVLDNADAGVADRNLVASVAIDRGEDLGDCPATHNDARVRIVDGNTEAPQSARFFVWFEL